MSARVGLPVLAERRPAFETCGYCPKLCRAACPISNAEPRETITPWGKMSLSWLMARGDVRVDQEHAKVAWACSGCFACRERCDHRNPVVESLYDVRADLHEAGVAPPAAQETAARHSERLARVRTVSSKLSRERSVEPSSKVALLIGCGYTLHAPEQAREIVQSTVALAGSVRLVDGCCGAPLAWAGDRVGAKRSRAALAESVAGAEQFVVADPGCAKALPELSPTLLVDLAMRELSRLRRLENVGDAKIRWHDPCQLGRGLGRYEEPRALLTRLIGRPPEEFTRSRRYAACSGAGSLVPLTFPAISDEIADSRLREHAGLGGGTIVTGCAASLKRFRSRGADVVDLATLLARAL
jgi:dimethylglycine catabolism B